MSDGAPAAPRRRWLPRSRLTVTLVGLTAALGLALVARAMRPPPPLATFGRLPGFRLVDSRGAPFTNEAMQGHASIADFFFTRCTSSCPRLTATMARLQSRLAKEASGVRLVSFSVDPENDTPPVLATYAANAHADSERWTFVTGPPDAVERAVVFGFKMSAAKVARGANDYDVTHGDWLVLVDAQSTIRGYYPVDTPEDESALLRDALRLERARR